MGDAIEDVPEDIGNESGADSRYREGDNIDSEA